MANEHIEKLKKLVKNNPKDIEKILADLLKNNKLTPDELLAAQQAQGDPLKIPPKILNNLGLNFRQGKNDFPQNEKLAIKLYEAAALQNFGAAYYNWAICARYGFGMEAKNIELAKGLFLKAIKFGYKDAIYHYGTLLWEEGNWEEAKKQFSIVESSNRDNSQEKNISDAWYYLGLFHFEKEKPRDVRKALFYFRWVKNTSKNYENAQKKIKEIKLFYSAKIKKKFELVEKEKPTTVVFQPDQNDVATFRPLKRKAWHEISPSLHGHDPQEEESVLMEYELAVLNCNTAKSAVELSKKHEKEVSEKELPVSVLEAIKEVTKKAEEKYSEAKASLQTAQINYSQMKNAVIDKRSKRQRKTEETFFAPERSYAKDAMDLCLTLQENRFSESAQNVKLLKVKDQPTRRLITAEIGVMSAGLELGNGFDGNTYGSHFGWTTGISKQSSGEFSSYSANYCHTETVALTEETKFQYHQRNNPHANHPGDYFMFNLGEYAQIISVIDGVTGSSTEKANIANEKKLASYMLRYSNTGQPMVLEELKQLNENTTEDDLVRIHRIFYHCCVKEPSRFFLANQDNRQLPLATANARALQLLVRGHLTMRDVFSQNAPYGVFTGKEIGKNTTGLNEKIDRINEKYEQQILNTNSHHADNYYAFMRHHPQGSTVPTRQQFREELQSVYGGINDSDGEGYDTEEDFTPAQKM